MKRAILIVMDGCGAGAAPDHAMFGDGPEVATIKNCWNAVGGINAPSLIKHGFFAACGLESAPDATFGRLRELSQGKDSVTGHWEMMGIITERAFPTYPDGFPIEIVESFESLIGRKVLGNKVASGTQIISELGDEHRRTGSPILYTSADSVFQIAAHESVVPLTQLYEWCTLARQMLVEPNNVQRVIARPFTGEPGGYTRTGSRRDFPCVPPPNLVDEIGDVFGVGVVPDLFAHRGFRDGIRTQNNEQHAEILFDGLRSDARFIFANFEDFDMLYGHRNDPIGFAGAIEAFDPVFNRVVNALLPDDLLILTADHGNDPTDVSTDHTREFVPVVLAGAKVKARKLGDHNGMGCIAATIAKHLGVNWVADCDALI